MATAELIQKANARLAAFEIEILASKAEWKAALLGEGDADKHSAKTYQLLSEQLIEAARLESLQKLLIKESAKDKVAAKRGRR